MKKLIAFFWLIAILPSCHEKAPELDDAIQFIGSWKLIEWTAQLTDGNIVYPYGEKPFGKIIYEENGEMMAIFMAENRSLMSSAEVTDRIPDEALQAFNSFFAFSGPFKVFADSGFVKHHIVSCINPNWVGQVQKRHFKFDKNNLTLSTPPIAVQGTNDESVQQNLIWERVY